MLQQIRKHLFAFLLPFSWCLHSYAYSGRALSLLDEDILLQAWLLYSHTCLLRKKLLAQLLPPKKSLCGATTKLSCYWTSRQTTRLQKQLKAWTNNTPRLLCARVVSFWRLHVESCRFQVVVFKSFHFEMRFQVVVFKLSFSCKREVHPQRNLCLRFLMKTQPCKRGLNFTHTTGFAYNIEARHYGWTVLVTLFTLL